MMNKLTIKKWLWMLLTLPTVMVMTGCASSPVPARMEAFSYEPSYPMNIPKKNLPKNGSLFLTGEGLSLFDDSKAHRVGDIITVMLSESFDAKKKDEAKYDKSNLQDYGVSNPLNLLGAGAAKLTGGAVNSLGIGYGSKGSFSGKSDVKQNSSLKGAIAVTVIEVIPNGNLVIRGEKWITVHDGSEMIRFAGIIRPQDILQDNSINSEKVADVRLIYQDLGISGDTSRVGALSKLINKYSPI